MLSEAIKSQLEAKLGQSILNVSRLSGGDISAVFKLSADTSSFVLKLNSGKTAANMFEAEAKGLGILAATQTLRIPEVIDYDTHEDQSYILMEFINTTRHTASSQRDLGIQLASLHQHLADTFGLDHDNFIGSLPQSNKQHDSWLSFYVFERLEPQLKMALDQGLLGTKESPHQQQLYEGCGKLFNEVQPALLHGDLWGGNVLTASDERAVLIDPAVYYGHHEVDIAMSLLFGGFSSDFYEHYHEIIPKAYGFEHRIKIYQLYYLLVHLNLFGRSYYSSVKAILDRYF